MIHMPSQTSLPSRRQDIGNTTTTDEKHTHRKTGSGDADSAGGPVRSRSLRTSVHLSSTVYSTETTYTPSSEEAPATYQKSTKVENREVHASESVSNTQSSDKQVGATVILAFIEQRLAADMSEGASSEALQSRLQAGLEGFIKGYNEAVQQLREMGLFVGDVKTAVETMFNDVITGISELAEKYGLENPAKDILPKDIPDAADSEKGTPVAAAPTRNAVAETLLDKLSTQVMSNSEVMHLQEMLKPTTDFYADIAEQNQEVEKHRSYSFELRTRDGDIVTIQSYAGQARSYQKSGDDVQFSQSEQSGFMFRVEGELDSDELTAINDLLMQLNSVADTFFKGDVFDAFNKALDVGFDSDEIARYSLNLGQSEYRKVETTYGSVAAALDDAAKVQKANEQQGLPTGTKGLAMFVQHLYEIAERSASAGLRDQLLDVADCVAQARYPQNEQLSKFRPFLSTLMESIENLNVQNG